MRPSSESSRALVEEAHEIFGAAVESFEVAVDLLRTQSLLGTDVDPSLVAKWGWNDVE